MQLAQRHDGVGQPRSNCHPFGQVHCSPPLCFFYVSPFDLCCSLCQKFSSNDRVQSAIIGLACFASAQLLNASLTNPMLPHVSLVTKLVSTPSIVAVLVKSPQTFVSPPRHVFQEKPARVHGDFIELNSILGPLFRPSSIPEHSLAPTPNMALFADAFHSRREAEQNVFFLRNCLRQHHDTLAEVLKAMAVKPESREHMFQWIATVLQANHERTQEMFRYQSAHMHMSSDGFMLNLFNALLRMCAPFLDPMQPNFQKIDYTYLLSNKRMQASNVVLCSISLFSFVHAALR